MLPHIRHISLVFAILLTIFSFLFFGREQRTYSTIRSVGLFLSGVSFIWILFKDSKQQKWLWVVVVVVAILIQQFSEGFLINCSYKILIAHNIELFKEVNQIMQSKAGDISYWKNSEAGRSKLNANEELKITELLRHTNIYLISKDSAKVYYGTYGMLDVRLGISYFYSDEKPDERFTRIDDRWYY